MLWGASFPLALAAVAARGQDPGRLVGGVYAANTVGAIIGALAFAMILVPHLGLKHWRADPDRVVRGVRRIGVGADDCQPPNRDFAERKHGPGPLVALTSFAMVVLVLSVYLIGNVKPMAMGRGGVWPQFGVVGVASGAGHSSSTKDIPKNDPDTTGTAFTSAKE